MKHTDITTTVMETIAEREKQRISSFRWRFFTLLGVLGILCISLFVVVGMRLRQQQTFDLLEVFSEDREIIAQFWQDTVISFLQELPQPETCIVGVVICVVVCAIVSTRRKRQILKRIENEIQKYTHG
jgi:hypothetical protein